MAANSKVQPEAVYGYLTVVRKIRTNKSRTHVLCRCSCSKNSLVVRSFCELTRSKTKPSCGCRRGRRLKDGFYDIPDDILSKPIYDLNYEESRYETSEEYKKRISVKTKVRRILLRRKWVEMVYASTKSERSNNRRHVEVCDEWKDPESGFSAYYDHFKKLVPRNVNVKYQIRRIDKELGFDPNNCFVSKVKRKRPNLKPKKKPTRKRKEDIPVGIYPHRNSHGIVYQVRYKRKYVGSTKTLKEAKQLLSAHLKSLCGKSLSVCEQEKQYRKHSRYNLWFKLKYRSTKSLAEGNLLMHPEWDHSNGVRGFIAFLEDAKKLGGEDYSFSLKRISRVGGFTPDNIDWTI